MDFVCRKTCQIRIGKQITLVEAGQVIDLDSPPTSNKACFVAMASKEHVLDFGTASEAELLKAKWKFTDLNAYSEANYEKAIRRNEGDKKSDVVTKFLDARYRATD